VNEKCICGHDVDEHYLDEDHCAWDPARGEVGGACLHPECGCCTCRPDDADELADQICQKLEELGIDPEKVVLVGHTVNYPPGGPIVVENMHVCVFECSTHGKVNAAPSANGNVYCPRCVQEAIIKYIESQPARPQLSEVMSGHFKTVSMGCAVPPIHGFGVPQDELLKGLRTLRKCLCDYTGDRCDCKYGGTGHTEQTGCPELRLVHDLIAALTQEHYETLRRKAGYS